MIHTIHVDRVLHETVATPYRDLVTRPTGAAVREGIARHMECQACPTAALDFSAVGLIDFSCADEVVAKLLLKMHPSTDRYLLLLGLEEHHAEAIDHVLGHHSLAVAAAQMDGEPLLLGRVGDDARRAFRHSLALGPGDSGDLADAMRWTIERAADALQALALLRLVVADQGRYQPLPLV
jgi:hypothetical protein